MVILLRALGESCVSARQGWAGEKNAQIDATRKWNRVLCVPRKSYAVIPSLQGNNPSCGERGTSKLGGAFVSLAG